MGYIAPVHSTAYLNFILDGLLVHNEINVLNMGAINLLLL